MVGAGVAQAQQESTKVDITLPLTGADVEEAIHIKNGAVMAIDEASAKGGVGGYKIDVVVYDSGTATAGVKLAKQAYDIIPNIIKASGDDVQGTSFLNAVGFPAVEGWYSTNASPHVTQTPEAADRVKRYKAKFGANTGYDDDTITSYNAALAMIDAIKRTAEAGKPADDLDAQNKYIGVAPATPGS